jgi:tetratricopeptide (TPR) repeat protein
MRLTAILLLCAAALRGQQAKEAPLGIIVDAKGGLETRSDSKGSLGAKPGVALFAGDSLQSAGAEIRVVLCNEHRSILLTRDADVLFESRGLRFRAGAALEPGPAECGLPPLARRIDPVRQHADVPLNVTAAAPQAVAPRQSAQLDAALAAADTPPTLFEPLRLARRAAVLAQFGKTAAAADALRTVTTAWPDAAWAKSWLHELEWAVAGARGVEALPVAEAGGKTYAVLIGVSDFQSEDIPKLRFAHRDAISFAELLSSPRGGGIASENTVLLTNEQATHLAIQEAIEKALKVRSRPEDTVLVVLASHGVVFEQNKQPKGYILAWDSNPADPALTAISMDYIRNLFATAIGRGTRLLLYVDVCHAGQIGQIVSPESRTNSYTEATLQAPERFFGLLAAQGKQVAMEGEQFGGGHGAFSYFLLDALNGSADRNGDGRITMNELSRHVLNNVEDSTDQKQTPKQIGEIDPSFVMATLDRPGIAMLPFRQRNLVASAASPSPSRGVDLTRFGGSSPAMSEEDRAAVRRLDEAILAGRLLPDLQDGAFAALRQLETRLPPDGYRNEAAKLRVALEDRGEQVLVKYLRGEEVPQQRSDFAAGAADFRAAAQLTRDSLLLESRILFCDGRAMLFDKRYGEARDLLERSVRLDPERAYSYNALGIAYLEQADYPRASAAFRDAAARAPYWAYPRHNLALAQSESGDYRAAIATYQETMRLSPGRAYVPYNLGLLYQRLNRRREAEAAYSSALAVAPEMAEALNAIGSLRAEQRRTADAERFYRTALDKNPGLLAARHNLAVLLSQNNARINEALTLWEENLRRSPDYLPSRVSVARALARAGRTDEAVRGYRYLVDQLPDYVAARLALADLYASSGDGSAALEQLEAAASQQPSNALIQERLGDVQALLDRSADARAAWSRALKAAREGKDRKRLARKLNTGVEGRGEDRGRARP